MSSEKGCDQAFDNMTEEPSAPLIENSASKLQKSSKSKAKNSGAKEQYDDTKLQENCSDI